MSRFMLPVGPFHPAVHEPEFFKVMVDGERIVDVDFAFGYNYRRIGKLATTKDWMRCLYLIERTCGICSHHHALCYVNNVEKLGKIEVPKRASYIRTIIAEFERLHSHLMWLGVMAEQIGFQTLFMLAWKDRETIMNLFEVLTGNRVHHGINTLSGVRRDWKTSDLHRIKRDMRILNKRARVLEDITLRDGVVNQRLANVGILDRPIAEEYGVVGPTARGSGVDNDIRKRMPYEVYGDVDFKVITESAGDALARTKVRIREIYESIHIVNQLVDKMPKGKVRTKKLITNVPKGIVQHAVEAPRGEDMHILVSGGKRPEYYHIRTPTYLAFGPLARILKNETIADIPTVVTSLDPCFGCMDRITIIDKDGKRREMELE
jgi:NADH-quinone oxidoreductase subunit D